MYKENTIGVVVPAYNEERFVGDVLNTIPEYVDRVYVVDDASTDGTWNVIQDHAEQINRRLSNDSDGDITRFARRVVPIQHTNNRGVGGAIKSGYLRALEDTIDVTAVIGADGQMDPCMLDRIIDPIVTCDADYSKGNRLIEPNDRAAVPPFRLFGNTLLSILTKISSGYWRISDPQNGYTAISFDALDTITIEKMYEDYGYCNDLLAALNVHGFRVVDVPCSIQYGEEESHIKYTTYIPKVSLLLLRNFCWRLRKKYVDWTVRPTSFFAIGITVVLLCIVRSFQWCINRNSGKSRSTRIKRLIVNIPSKAITRIRDSEV